VSQLPFDIASSLSGAGRRTLLIAEIGSNHNCDLALAKQLIDASAKARWDAVKFQLFRAEWLYPPNCGVVATPAGNVDFFDVLKKAELPPEFLFELREYSHRQGLAFLCTPFDVDAVDKLEEIGVDAYKIASPELNHFPLLRAVTKTGRPLICSTGLCTLTDVEGALSTIRETASDRLVALLQCTTAYPTPPEQANLAAITTLARAFGVACGLSDHTMDPTVVPAVSIAAGGRVIEKHVTLSRKLPGPDHAFAIEPDEMASMASVVREVEAIPPEERMAFVNGRWGREVVAAMLGHGRKEIMPCEAELYPCDKRSIVAMRPLRPGDRLSPDCLRILRSERNLKPGLHPRHWEEIMGAKVVRPVELGVGVTWDDLLDKPA
jgi:N-acetylneuraminate synthase